MCLSKAKIECKAVLVRANLFLFSQDTTLIVPMNEKTKIKTSRNNLTFIVQYTESEEQKKIRLIVFAYHEFDDWDQHFYDVRHDGYNDLLQYTKILLPIDYIEPIYVYDLFNRYITLSRPQLEWITHFFNIAIVDSLEFPLADDQLDLSIMKKPIDFSYIFAPKSINLISSTSEDSTSPKNHSLGEISPKGVDANLGSASYEEIIIFEHVSPRYVRNDIHSGKSTEEVFIAEENTSEVNNVIIEENIVEKMTPEKITGITTGS